MTETDKTSRNDPAMAPNAEHYDPRKDEIDLVDLWRALVRQKWVFGTIFLLTLLGAGTYLLTVSPVYESKATIQIGQLAGLSASGSEVSPGLLEGADQFARRLREMPSETTGHTRFHSASITDKATEDMVTVTLRAESGAEAQHALADNLEPVLAKHTVVFDAGMGLMRSRRANMQTQIEVLREQTEVLQAEVGQLREVSPTQASLLLLEIGNLTRQIPTLENQVQTLNERLLDSRSYPTRLISGPTLPETPVEPKTQLVLALAVVLGLTLGLVGAFFGEFLRVARSS